MGAHECTHLVEAEAALLAVEALGVVVCCLARLAAERDQAGCDGPVALDTALLLDIPQYAMV